MEDTSRFFLHLGYKGTAYRGWQRQPNATSIQQTIEEVLENKFGRKIHCMGCGRTDAGVHASQFFAHVDCETVWSQETLFHLNKMLPEDIALFDMLPVAASASAQLDANDRTYNYFLHFNKHPYLNELSTLYQRRKLSIEKMAKAVGLLPKYNDYLSFCKTPSAYKHTRCIINNAELYVQKQTKQIRFEFTANRFLRGMVRLLVARLLELGRGEISFQEFESYLAEQHPLKHRTPAYPQGLYLSKVTYPYLEVSGKSGFSLLKSDDSSWTPI